MVDSQADRLPQLARVLITAATSAGDVDEFLIAALCEIGRTLGGCEAALVQVVAGEWTSVGDRLPDSLTLPINLLATAADGDSIAQDPNWSAIPLERVSQSDGQPAILQLLIYHSQNEPPTAKQLGEVAQPLAPLISLVRSRTDAQRAARREVVRRRLHADDLTMEQLLESARSALAADGVYVFAGSGSGELQSATTAQILDTELSAAALDNCQAISNADLCRRLTATLGVPVTSIIASEIGTGEASIQSDGRRGQSLGIMLATRKEDGQPFSVNDGKDLAVFAAAAARLLPAEQGNGVALTDLIGESRLMVEVQDRIERVAPTELPVLIMGENGTGKEIASRQIHKLSSRRDQPFLAVNCGALSETLLESELFGHEKGAFTDANESRAGKFEAANGGTLFLDEIGELSSGGQVKLLRVLEEKIVVRVGGTLPITTDTRVLAATNRDLAAMVREGKFREDLFFRLNVVTLELPPLRDRGQDVILLADQFLQHFASQAGLSAARLNAAAHRRLRTHSWPGNVRELRNLMERVAFLTNEEEIGPETLGLRTELLSNSIQNLSEATREFQISHIQTQIVAANGNMTEAATRLGLHRSNLYRKMKQLGMQTDE